jgi:hypothetical protein
MDIRKDNGVSPVIATVLLLALSVVLIALVAVVVMAGVSSFTPVENKVVGFTVEVNATNNSALITPVSGTDRPFMESYRVYTNNGHWDSSDAGELTVPEFNSTVTYVNIVGNFTDHVTALVFSGKVVVEGGVVIVVSPYYVVGSDGYNTTTEFADSFNDWYNTYYNTGLHPGDPGYDVVDDQFGNGLEFNNDLPIIIGNLPITISSGNIRDLTNNFRISVSGGGNFTRAPGYESALFVINLSKVKIEEGALILDGMGLPATHPALEIIGSSELSIENGGDLLVKNNINSNGTGGGIYNEGTITIKNPGSLVLTGNEAYIGGGIYNAGTIDINKDGILTITGNEAYNGGGIYNTGSITRHSQGDALITANHAIHYGGGVYSYTWVPFTLTQVYSNTADGNPITNNFYIGH